MKIQIIAYGIKNMYMFGRTPVKNEIPNINTNEIPKLIEEDNI